MEDYKKLLGPRLWNSAQAMQKHRKAVCIVLFIISLAGTAVIYLVNLRYPGFVSLPCYNDACVD